MNWLLLTIFLSFTCLERNPVVCILCPKGLSPSFSVWTPGSDITYQQSPTFSVWTLGSDITYQQQLLDCRPVTETLQALLTEVSFSINVI